jgi:hypothetical protein
MIFEIINSVACIVLAVLTWPVANAMHNRKFWPQRFGLWVIVATLGLQAYGPFSDGIPPANPIGAVFMAFLVGIVIRHRHQIMAAVRLAVGEVAAESEHPMRRMEDLETAGLVAVRGRGVD